MVPANRLFESSGKENPGITCFVKNRRNDFIIQADRLKWVSSFWDAETKIFEGGAKESCCISFQDNSSSGFLETSPYC